MTTNHEAQIVDFEKVLREIQEESLRRLSEILEGNMSSNYTEEATGRGVKMPRIIDIFIPPGAK